MRILTLIFSLFLFAPFLMAQDAIRGQYQPVGPVPQKHSLDKVVFEEFLNFGCPHCNNFRNQTKEFKEKYKGTVEFVDVPILFRGQGDAPLRLYYVAKKLGRADEVKHAIFDAKFKHNVDVFDPGIVNYLARSLGMGSEFRDQAQGADITAEIENGERMAKIYGVNATPTIILANSLKMNIGRSMEEFVENLPNTIDDLVKK